METHITYKKELRLGDEVDIEMWLSELSGVSAWMEFVFLNGKGELVATGRQRGVFIEISTGRPRRLTPEDRVRCEAYLATDSAYICFYSTLDLHLVRALHPSLPSILPSFFGLSFLPQRKEGRF